MRPPLLAALVIGHLFQAAGRRLSFSLTALTTPSPLAAHWLAAPRMHEERS